MRPHQCDVISASYKVLQGSQVMALCIAIVLMAFAADACRCGQHYGLLVV